MLTITKFGRTYHEGGNCPACSGTKDKGGRLAAKKRKNLFLICFKCKYTIHSEKVVLNQIVRAQKLHDKQIGMAAKKHI